MEKKSKRLFKFKNKKRILFQLFQQKCNFAPRITGIVKAKQIERRKRKQKEKKEEEEEKHWLMFSER